MTNPQATNRIAEAVSEMRDLNQTAKDLSVKFDIGTRAVRRMRGLTIVVVLLIIVLSAGALTTGIVIYRQGQRIEGISRRIDDCLNQDGDCYRRQQENTRGFVLQITDSNHNGKADSAEILAALKEILERN